MAKPMQPCDQVARLGRHAAAHPARGGADDQDLHRLDRAISCATTG
jgi:hypothetical protein